MQKQGLPEDTRPLLHEEMFTLERNNAHNVEMKVLLFVILLVSTLETALNKVHVKTNTGTLETNTGTLKMVLNMDRTNTGTLENEVCVLM